MSKPRLLDLFCGAGGCSVGYHRAGFEFVGVDIEPMPNYPFEFVEADALKVMERLLSGSDHGLRAPVGLGESGRYDLCDFDAIHASPPCQAHTSLQSAWNAKEHEDLVGRTRELLQATGLPYVIENVPGAPLIEPIQLCGSSFNLGVRRHRLFECNFPVMALPCAHGQQNGKYEVYEHGRWYESPVAKVYGSGGGKAMDRWAEAMDIDWMSHAEMAQAIPPAYTEHIGLYLRQHLDYLHAKRRGDHDLQGAGL